MSDTKQRTTRLGATSVAEAPPAAVFWRASAFSGVSPLCPHWRHASEHVHPRSLRQTPGVAASAIGYLPVKRVRNDDQTAVSR